MKVSVWSDWVLINISSPSKYISLKKKKNLKTITQKNKKENLFFIDKGFKNIGFKLDFGYPLIQVLPEWNEMLKLSFAGVSVNASFTLVVELKRTVPCISPLLLFCSILASLIVKGTLILLYNFSSN